MSKDYYNILGIAENASKADIKKAFRSLAKKYHPDRNQGDKTAEAKFKDISEAYDVLNDDKKRQQYDMMRKYGAFAGTGGPGGGAGGFDFSNFSNGSFSAEDLGGFGSFADIFSSIFGGNDIFGRAARAGTGRGSRVRPTATRGNDLSLTLSISFEESISGTKKTIALNKPETCRVCSGTGAEPGSGQQTCPQCGGRGTISTAQGAFSVSRPCPRCFGRGVTPGQSCRVCNGTGQTKVKKKIAVKIPAGVEDGGKIRLRGIGNPGRNGGQNGDLIITVAVKKHQQFERKGQNIYTSVEVSYPQAVLGCKVPVKTLTKTINLTIPPGTGHGTKLRLKGMGLAINGTKGDQYVEVNITVPKKVSSKQKKILEELQKVL